MITFEEVTAEIQPEAAPPQAAAAPAQPGMPADWREQLERELCLRAERCQRLLAD